MTKIILTAKNAAGVKILQDCHLKGKARALANLHRDSDPPYSITIAFRVEVPRRVLEINAVALLSDFGIKEEDVRIEFV